MRQFLKDHSLVDLWHRHPQLLAYTLLVVVTIVGFWRINGVQEKQRKDSRERFVVACLVLNENKDLVSDFTNTLISVSRQNPQPGITEEQRKQQEKVINQFLGTLAPKFQHLDCQRFAAHPEQYLQQIKPTTRS